MSDKIYLLVIEGKPTGPFSVEELILRNISADDFVKAPGMDDYKQVSEMKELADALSLKYVGTLPQYFAGIDQRMVAALLDWLLVFGMWMVVAVVAALFLDKDTLLIALAVWFATMPFARMIYQITAENSARQATLGKRALSIKVTDEMGSKPTSKQIIGRNIGKFLSTMPLFMGYVMGFFNARNQCLHDGLAGTLVVKERLL